MGTFRVIPSEVKEQILNRIKSEGITAAQAATKDGDPLISFIAFSESAQQELLTLQAGDAVTVAGRGALQHWTGRDGIERHGLSVVAERVLAGQPPKPKPKPKPAPEIQPALEFPDDIPF